LVLSSSPSHAALDKCQKAIYGEGVKLQKFISTAVENCANAIRKEKVKGTVTTLGTNCGPGAGCMPTATAYCEKQLAGVYDALNAKPGKSKVDAFRGALEKTRYSPKIPPVKVCEDADLAVFSGMGHITSGTTTALPIGPPALAGPCTDSNLDGKFDLNCGGKFTIDWLLFALENAVIKQIVAQTPDLLSLFADAIGQGDTLNPKKFLTNCSPLDAGEEIDHVYQPNLCRFGVECRGATCQIDTAGTCSTSLTACDASAPVCPPGESCIPTNSKVQLQSPTLDYFLNLGPLPIPVFGSLNQEVCRAGPVSGVCKTGSTPVGGCLEDGDCSSGPCSFFPGLGLGAAFGSEPNVLYLIGSAAKGIKAPQPPINVIPFSTLVDSVCVDVIQAEGWCDCSGLGIHNDAEVCQDHIANDTVGLTDECTALQSEAEQDSVFASALNGPLHVNISGSSVAGDCVDLVTLQFKIITTASDRGPDGIACTDDDYVAPTATFTVPLTTGTATAKIKDALDNAGTCSVTTATKCMRSADCPGVETCSTGAYSDFQLGPVTGNGTSCANYQAGNLSGLSLVSAATLLNLEIDAGFGTQPVDGGLTFQLTCK
jgi:hypothetical protein